MADDAITVTQELKPCPFCGGEAQRFTLTEEDEPMNAGGDVITCLKCQASSHVEFGRKENLVSCWNTRTTSLAAQDGLVEAICQARCFTPSVRWDDGMTEGAAQIERMIAEKIIEVFQSWPLSAIRENKS